MLFASVLQCNKSMLSCWKDFRQFHNLLSGTQKTTYLPGHGPMKKKIYTHIQKIIIIIVALLLPALYRTLESKQRSQSSIRPHCTRWCAAQGNKSPAPRRLQAKLAEAGETEPDLSLPNKSRDKSRVPGLPIFRKTAGKGNRSKDRTYILGQSTLRCHSYPSSFCGSCCPECCALS